MNKICTTIEQSQKLMELGLDVNTADMYYKYVLPKSDRIHHIPEIGNPINALKWYNEGYTFSGKKEPVTLNEFCVPCWSLAALLSVLKERDDCNALDMFTNRAQLCTITTSYYKDASWKNISITSDNPVDACYEMIIKLKKQNLL